MSSFRPIGLTPKQFGAINALVTLAAMSTFPMILTSFYLGLSNRLATRRCLSKWTWAGGCTFRSQES